MEMPYQEELEHFEYIIEKFSLEKDILRAAEFEMTSAELRDVIKIVKMPG